MNLKNIITTAGFCLLPLCFSGLASAKPVAATSVTADVAAQQDQDDPDDCGFAYAVIYGQGCWVRVDQCGTESVHGCLDESAQQKLSSSSRLGQTLAPLWLKKETD